MPLLDNARLKDYLAYLKSIGYLEERPFSMVFAGRTSSTGVLPTIQPIFTEDTRHFFFNEVSGFIEPAAANPVNSEANLSSNIFFDITIGNDQVRLWGVSPVPFAAIIGTPLHPKEKYQLPFWFHAEPKTPFTCTLSYASGFTVPANRYIWLQLNGLILIKVEARQ